MKTIRAKIMLSMLALVFLVTLSLSATYLWYFTGNNSENIEGNNRLLAKEAAINFDHTAEAYIRSFDQFVNSDAFSSEYSDEEKIKNAFDRYVSDKMFTSFGIYTSDGKLKYSNTSGCADVISEEDVVKAYERSEVTTTNIVCIDEKRYFAIITPIPIDTENVPNSRDMAAAVVCCDDLGGTLDTITDSTDNRAYGLSADGLVLFTSGPTAAKLGERPIEIGDTNKDYESIANAFRTILNGQEGSCSYTLDETNMTAGYSPSTHFGVVIVVTTPTNSGLFKMSSTSVRLIIVLVTMIIAVTVIFAMLFAKRLSVPIVSSTNRLRALSNGDISTRVDVWYSRDELGVLSNSLEETIVSLRQYINLIQIALQNIADGNLSHRMEGNFKGDFKKIKDTFNQIFESLTVTFDSINHSAEQVTSGAVMVSNSAQALSQGATQQASAIEELSATLNGVSDQVIQNSESAKNAYTIVNDNTEAMKVCNDDMGSMLAAMKMISETSEEITTILKVIDDISFQTNILALNAAVEAAREGSKGFGVVADEVRQLAARSAEAAKQTAALIKKSTFAVRNGTSIAEQTAESLDTLAKDSERISELIRNIADASAEQSEAIMQINTGVDQISAVVSANTASAVGSASASEELSSQSLILKNMIAKFRLTAEDGIEGLGSSDSNFASAAGDYDDENDGLDISVDDDDQLPENIDDEDDKY